MRIIRGAVNIAALMREVARLIMVIISAAIPRCRYFLAAVLYNY